jgi:hypothetical protein
VVDPSIYPGYLTNPHPPSAPTTSHNPTFCPIGRRTGETFLLSGAVIPVWPLLQDVIHGDKGEGSKFIQVRLRSIKSLRHSLGKSHAPDT